MSIERLLLACVWALFLAACSTRGDFLRVDELSPEKAALAQQAGTREVIFVGTSRKLEEGRFGPGRGDVTSFLRFDISVPPEREVGEVSWPRDAARANPVTDFLTLAEIRYPDERTFRRDVQAAMRRRGQSDVVVYVHGYNNTMAESIYRVAQMHNDLKVPGVAVHYAWPSNGSVLGYVYDRDSAMFARDSFEDLLQQVAQAGARRIVIVAHSMGSFVTMETLRQVAIRGDALVRNRLGGVILISPDLDVDLFRAQTRAIGKLPQPFLIFGSHRDSVLRVSSRIAGQSERLGNLRDLTPIAGLDVIYLDTAAYSTGAGHFNIATSPSLVRLLGGIAELDESFSAEGQARTGLLPRVVMMMRSATEIAIAPVKELAEGGAAGR